jgi:hypothetical protein
VLRGIFKKVIFLGRRQKTGKFARRRIGTVLGQGKWIQTDLRLSRLCRRLYPDVKEWYYRIVAAPADIRVKGPAALDIDLDYFCGFYFPLPPQDPGIWFSQPQLHQFDMANLSHDKYRIALFPQVRSKRRRPLSYSLPQREIMYNDSRHWVEYAIGAFVQGITFKPDVISICRSTRSGYTPAKHGQFIEDTLIGYLKGDKKGIIDPCDIDEPFQVQPFIVYLGDRLYNPLTREFILLSRDHAFVWRLLGKGETFGRILSRMMRLYTIDSAILKQGLLNFILRLKENWVLS